MIEILILQGVCVNCKVWVGIFLNYNLKLSYLVLIDFIVIEKQFVYFDGDRVVFYIFINYFVKLL